MSSRNALTGPCCVVLPPWGSVVRYSEYLAKSAMVMLSKMYEDVWTISVPPSTNEPCSKPPVAPEKIMLGVSLRIAKPKAAP